MATSQGFNKPRVSFTKVNRKKRQEKKKAQGTAVQGKKAQLAVSGVRTKKHARKMEHRKRMQERAEAVAAAAAEAAVSAPQDVEMTKARVKKPRVKRVAMKE